MTIVYILLTLLLLSIMVVIHELGHFLFAKLFKVTVLEFSIGMGPALYTTKKKKDKHGQEDLPFELSESFTRESEYHNTKSSDNKEKITTDAEPVTNEQTESDGQQKTVFSVRAFPIGGYVSMAGEDQASTDKNAFCNKKVWQRLIITIAGPIMNLLLGFLCVCILVGIDGMENRLPSNTITYEDVEGAVSNTGENPLMSGDKIIKVNNTAVHTGNELDYEITHQGYEPVDLTVIRNGEKIVLKGVTFPVQEVQGISIGNIDFMIYREQVSFSSVVRHAYFRSVSMAKMVIDSLLDLVRGKYGIDALSGPVGVSEVVGEATKGGFYPVLYLFAFITINLGIFNLIPLPALDGGRIIFLAYEGIFRKPVKKEVEQAVNTVGLMLLMGFAVFIMIKDIFGLF